MSLYITIVISNDYNSTVLHGTKKKKKERERRECCLLTQMFGRIYHRFGNDGKQMINTPQ